MVGGSLAFTLGPLLIIAGVSWWGLEGIWRLLPIALVESVLLFWLTRDLETSQPLGTKPNGKWAASWQTLKPVMLPLTGILITQTFMQVSIGTYLPTYLSLQGASLWVAGCSVPHAAAQDEYVDRILWITLLVAPPLMILFMRTDGWIQIVALVLMGFTSLSTTPIALALVQEYSPDHRATANGLYFAVMFAGRSLIIILVGAAADWWGLQTAFYVTALLGFLALPFVRLLPGEQVDFSPENL